MMHSRQREYERRIEELEDKLNRNQDDSDEQRRKAERLERTTWE